MAHVTVLGAGIVGLSVALSAKAFGHTVAIKARQRIGDPQAERNPLFASAFPAASVIPHSVPGDDVVPLLGVSTRIFEILSRMPEAGVGLHDHFELFEGRHALPDYSGALRAFRVVKDGTSPIARKGAAAVSGYAFECFFCDMPLYGAWIVQMLERLDIAFERTAIDTSFVRALKTDVVVNCLGAGAHEVYDDIGEGILYRGVMLSCPLPRGADVAASYNYTPAYDVYPGFGGRAADVYFYPRRDDCVLGGMRQPGRIDAKTGAFLPLEPVQGDVVTIDGIEIPKPIIDLNRELVSQLTGATLTGECRAMSGYRHVDGTPTDPRLTIALRTRAGMAPHIDCIGFGGAGVTLSWGAASRVVELLASLGGARGTALGVDEFAAAIARLVR